MDKIKAIEERLELVEILKGKQIQIELMSYWQPLVLYHLLTCFDILGQDREHLKFNAWIKLKKNDDAFFEKYKNKKLPNAIESIYNKYVKEYSVKESFFKGINISRHYTQKIFDSLELREFDTIIEFKDEDKIDFLFEIRNRYTHNGEILYGHGKYIVDIQNMHYLKEEGNMVYCITNNWIEIIEEAVKMSLVEYQKNS